MAFQLPEYRAPDFSRLPAPPEALFLPAPRDGVAPENYHATTIFPEYFRVSHDWLLAEDSRMDCVAVLKKGRVETVELRSLKTGDPVAVGRSEDGSEGIFVHPHGFSLARGVAGDAFSFRQSRSRETAYSSDYDLLCELLRHEKDHGRILWVLGPACVFDADSRAAFTSLVRGGYVHALLAGNALATHDLEAGYLHTALGQDIYTQESRPNGHYHHLDTLNAVRAAGSVAAFIESGAVKDGVLFECVRKCVPCVLAGSIRDDGPLPDVIADVYTAQDAMRAELRRATTVICMASALHTIAAGNMTPSYRVAEGRIRPLYFYSVDVSEFAVNKLRDRGSLAVRTIVANVQDFIVRVSRGV